MTFNEEGATTVATNLCPSPSAYVAFPESYGVNLFMAGMQHTTSSLAVFEETPLKDELWARNCAQTIFVWLATV